MTKGLRPDELPGWPRCMREALAAAYVGLSPSSFRRCVEARDAPAPVRLVQGCPGWLRDDLDAWLDRQAGRAPALSGASLWDG